MLRPGRAPCRFLISSRSGAHLVAPAGRCDMTAIAESAPRWVVTVLRWDWTLVLARLAIASSYLIGGLDKAIDFPAAVAEQAHFGLQPAWLWASVTILVELGGSLLLVWGRLVWLAAGGLGVLTG